MRRGDAGGVAGAGRPRGTMDAVETARDLTGEQRAQLELAIELHRPLARAANLGRSNARGYVAIGALSLLVNAIWPDVLGLAISVIAVAVGAAQLSAAKKLRRADPTAPRSLARNELMLMGGIIAYSLVKLTTGPGLDLRGVDASELGINLNELADATNTIAYATFIAVTLIYQGGLALYFLRRRPMLERYLAEAPEWARGTVESLGN